MRFRGMACYLWVAPCSLLGVMLALLLGGSGLRGAWQDGVLEVALAAPHGWRARHLQRLPFCAITLGHVVIGIDQAVLQRWRRHEHCHVRQYERWGVLFLLAYPLASVLAWLRGGQAYRDNVFEQAARDAERH